MPSSLGETELHPLGRRERLIRLRLSEGGWEENERKGLGGRCPSSLLFLPFFSHSASTMARERAANRRPRGVETRFGSFLSNPHLVPSDNASPPPLSHTHTIAPSTGLHRAPAPGPHLRGDRLFGEQGRVPRLRAADTRGRPRRRGRGARRVGAQQQLGGGVGRFGEFCACFLFSVCFSLSVFSLILGGTDSCYCRSRHAAEGCRDGGGSVEGSAREIADWKPSIKRFREKKQSVVSVETSSSPPLSLTPLFSFSLSLL